MEDPEGQCRICPTVQRLAPYDPAFRSWMAGLLTLDGWIQAGYPINADDLDFPSWNALAAIRQYRKTREAELMGAILGGR